MGFGLNILGAAAGYQGYRDELKRQKDEERQAAADAQALKDQAYQEEVRSRQRFDWSEADRIRHADREADAAYLARFKDPATPAAPSAPAATSATTPAAPGAPAVQKPAQQGLPDPTSPGVTTYGVED